MLHTLKFYYLKGKLEIVGIEFEGVKHFTGDIRAWNPNELLFVFSRGTVENKILNSENMAEMVGWGYYILVEKVVEVEIQKDIYTYCYVSPKYNLLDNQ
jgi:hypothetical protein